jgi:hypothetical protein
MGGNWKTVVLSRTTEFPSNLVYTFSGDFKKKAAEAWSTDGDVLEGQHYFSTLKDSGI